MCEHGKDHVPGSARDWGRGWLSCSALLLPPDRWRAQHNARSRHEYGGFVEATSRIDRIAKSIWKRNELQRSTHEPGQRRGRRRVWWPRRGCRGSWWPSARWCASARSATDDRDSLRLRSAHSQRKSRQTKRQQQTFAFVDGHGERLAHGVADLIERPRVHADGATQRPRAAHELRQHQRA